MWDKVCVYVGGGGMCLCVGGGGGQSVCVRWGWWYVFVWVGGVGGRVKEGYVQTVPDHIFQQY